MNRKNIFFPPNLIIIFILLVSGCKDDEVAPVTDYGFGTITGTAYLYNESDALYGPHAGAGVRISLIDTSGKVTDSTMTDSSGNWTLLNVSAGTYDCVLSKNGYGTTTILGYVYSGRKDIMTFQSVSLGQIPGFEAESLTVALTTDSLVVTGKVTGDAPYRRYVILYFASDSSVTNLHYIRDYYLSRIQPSQKTFRLAISLSYLRIFYFMDSHMPAWIAAYSYVPGSTIGPYGNLYYVTSVGTSLVKVGFTMP